MKKISILYIIVNFIISIYFIDLWSNAQNNSRGLPIVCLFESGHINFDKYQDKTCDKCIVNGHVYSDKAPLPTFTVIPFYGILNLTGVFKSSVDDSTFKNVYALGAILCGVLPFLLILWLSFKNVFADNNPKSLNFETLMLVMLPWYASFLFVFAGTFFGHLFSGALMLGAYIMLKKRSYLYCGLLAGLSVASEYTLVIFPVIWFIQSGIKEKSLKLPVRMVLGALPSILFLFIYNYFITGNPLDNPYKYVTDDYAVMKTNFGFGLPSLNSLFGLSFSPYRGLFFYMPFLLLVLSVVCKNMTKIPLRTYLLHPLVISSVIYFVLISSYYSWWGGWTYGPRHLTIIAILISYEAIPYLIKHGYSKIFFWITTSFGLITAFITRITQQYSIPSEIKNPLVDLIIPAFLKKEFNDNNLLSIIFGCSSTLAAIAWVFLFLIGIIAIKLYINRYNHRTERCSRSAP